MDKYIEVVDLSKNYQSEFSALSSINFSIKKSEKIAFVGLEGSGKTSLLDIIAGLKDYSGSLTIDGTERSSLTNQKISISYIKKEPVFFNLSSVKRNLLFYFKNFEKTEKKLALKKIYSALELFNAKKLLNKPIYKLTKFEKIVIALVRSYLKKPEVLLVDEPFSDDELNNAEILRMLNLYQSHVKSTIILASSKIDASDMLETNGFGVRILYFGSLLPYNSHTASNNNPENLFLAESFGKFNFVQNYHTKTTHDTVVFESDNGEFYIENRQFKNLPDFIDLSDSQVVVLSSVYPVYQNGKNVESSQVFSAPFFVFDAVTGVRLF